MYHDNMPNDFEGNQGEEHTENSRQNDFTDMEKDATGDAAQSTSTDEAQSTSANEARNASAGTWQGGSTQGQQEHSPYRNYYDERYRGGQNAQGSQGSSTAQNGYDYQSSSTAQGSYGYQSSSTAQGSYGYQGSSTAQGSYDYQSDSTGHGSYDYQGGSTGQGSYGYQSDSTAHGGYHDQGNSGAEKKPRKKKRSMRIAVAVLLVAVFVGFCGGISYLAVSSLEDQMTSASAGEMTEAQPQLPEAQEDQQQSSASSGTGGGQIRSAGTIQESGTVTAVVTDVTDVVERVMPACVSVTNNYTEQVQDFWGQSYSMEEVASGSGIIIGENDTELLIVTNNHVVEDANSLQIQFIDGAVTEAQVKGMDASADLAVLAVKLDDIEEETKSVICIAQMGDSDSLKIGEPAIAIGNALGYGQSVTTGVISALNRTLEVNEDGSSNALIQTDAAINPGNSGGALLNINGEVIGINSSKIGASVVEGMGYAIPISTAKPIIEELMTYETRQRVSDDEKGYLGISCINVTSEITENFSMPEGIFVAQVYEDTGADRAGLVRGDIITAVNGVTVTTQEELTKQLGYYRAGETVEITIMQGSPTGYQEKNVQVTLSTYEELSESSRRSEETEEESGSGMWQLP